jgi:hypothetical protein
MRGTGVGALALLALGLGLTGCGGLAASNVGDPTLQARLDFQARLDLVHPGMPADSLDLLFAAAAQPGETGILRRTRIVTAEGESGTVSLGWRSDPRHQIGGKTSREVEIERALVVIEGARVQRVERRD